MKKILILLLLFFTGLSVQAEQELYSFNDPIKKQTFLDITKKMRCTVCQNQTLYDSKAPLAEDLKEEIQNLLLNGESEKNIEQFMLNRYGDFILYTPPLRSNTFLLWAAPIIFLAIGCFVLSRFFRRQS